MKKQVEWQTFSNRLLRTDHIMKIISIWNAVIDYYGRAISALISSMKIQKVVSSCLAAVKHERRLR